MTNMSLKCNLAGLEFIYLLVFFGRGWARPLISKRGWSSLALCHSGKRRKPEKHIWAQHRFFDFYKKIKINWAWKLFSPNRGNWDSECQSYMLKIWRKFGFLTKIWMFDQNFYLWENFYFSTKCWFIKKLKLELIFLTKVYHIPYISSLWSGRNMDFWFKEIKINCQLIIGVYNVILIIGLSILSYTVLYYILYIA